MQPDRPCAVAWRGKDGRKILIRADHVAQMMAKAHADLAEMTARHERNYEALCHEAGELREQVEELRRELAELRQLAGLRDPSQPLQ